MAQPNYNNSSASNNCFMNRSMVDKPWSTEKDSLLRVSATTFNDAYQRSVASLFAGIQPARTEDIASRVLAELADESFLEPLTDDIFDEIPPPAPTQSSGGLSNVLQSTLDQVLTMELQLKDKDQTPSTKRTLPTPLPQKDAKRRRIVEPTPPSEQDEDPARRFRPYQSEQWTEKFDELKAFREQRGHCCVPHTFDENPSLARWVKRQRYQYKLKNEGKASTMTDERITLLENVGFVWDSHGASWMERWNELAEFSKLHGHANVPSNHAPNPQLATWVKCQRRQYKLFWEGKPSNMSLERINRLEQVGFEWELRASHKKSPKKEMQQPNPSFPAAWPF
eukprot:Nitzschia sp. Nitz4//scaffold29_size155292//152139//153152//NITZ4_002692-RA/size155292-processed-gene-0.32-mRNA-1//1//CDS//3329546550//4085//frame0